MAFLCFSIRDQMNVAQVPPSDPDVTYGVSQHNAYNDQPTDCRVTQMTFLPSVPKTVLAHSTCLVVR